MIIRKPYAFLIKNFKKIHILILLLSLYIVYKLFDVSSFINEFMRLGTYDLFLDPITNHITLFLQISILIIFVASTAILALLRYKGKPWKIYLVPVIEYLVLFFVLNMIKGFFNSYTDTIETTDLRLSRDLLMIFIIAQFPAIGIFVMRILGLDKKKFNFNQDKEFLELNEKDREEVEINIDIDKSSFKRLFKKIKRNFNYSYEEHKKIYISIFAILILGVVFNCYKYFFVTNKSYAEGDYYSANGYTLKVNNSYYADKDYSGNIISDKSNFVILDLTIKNNSEARTIKMENFHIKNGVSDFKTTRKIYEKEFSDLGKTYDSVKELKRNETANFIIIFKVDKKLNKDKFVLYYQENSGKLRKIKIKVNDLTKNDKTKTLSLGDNMELNIVSNPDTVSFDFFEIVKSSEYTIRDCTTDNCNIENRNVIAPENYNILKVDFGSVVYDTTAMKDFMTKYAKIKYKNADNQYEEIEIVNLINRKYYGKILFLKIPSEVKADSDVSFEFTIRNSKYSYKLS